MTFRRVACALALAACLPPVAIHAAGQSPGQQRCILKSARAFALVAQAQRRDVARCLCGALPAGQTPAGCIAADGAGRVARARIRAIRTDAAACASAPAFGWRAGASADVDGASGAGLARAVFGAALDAPVSADGRRCRAAVLAQVDRCASAFVREYARCAAHALATASDASALVRCKGDDPRGRIAAACDAGLADAVATRCAGEDPSALFPGCAGTPTARCLAGHARAAASRGLNATGDLCPLGPPPPAPEPLQVDVVPLPPNVQSAETPWFTVDGSRLLFSVILAGVPGQQIATIAPDGSDFRCLTCPLATPGVAPLWKPIPFRDGRRVVVRVGEQTPLAAADHGILECRPSVLDCQQAVVVPVEPPSAGDPNVSQDERELRPAPDGLHVGVTQIRSGTPVSIVGRLERLADRYEIRDARVVSAVGELKQFTPDQRAVIIAAYAQNPYGAANPDAVRVDLADGRVSRVTNHPDYDEPVELSPDGEWFAVGSGRGGDFLSVFSQVPRPGFLNVAMETVVGFFFATQRAPLLEPWLVDRWGARGDYKGQLLNPGAFAEGWEGRMIMNWSPDGTRIAFWEAPISPGPDWQGGPSRLVVTTLTSRTPTTLPAPQPMPSLDWAPSVAGYVPPPHDPTSRAGAFSGTATVSYVPGTVHQLAVTWTDFSDDGRDFIDGTERFEFVPGTLGRMTWDADVRLHGCRQGRLTATQARTTVLTFAGRVESEVDGRHLVME